MESRSYPCPDSSRSNRQAIAALSLSIQGVVVGKCEVNKRIDSNVWRRGKTDLCPPAVKVCWQSENKIHGNSGNFI